MGEQRGIQRGSSRREEPKIAQGETLGKRSAEGFPPWRGGVKALHRRWVPQSVMQVFDPPFQGGWLSLCLLPRAASAAADLPWAIFDVSLREQADARLIGWPIS